MSFAIFPILFFQRIGDFSKLSVNVAVIYAVAVLATQKIDLLIEKLMSGLCGC